MKLVYFGDSQSKIFHIYDLMSKYHQDILFYHIDDFKLEELKKAKILTDSDFIKSDFDKEIFAFFDDKTYHFNKILSFDNLDNFIHNVRHPDYMVLNSYFELLIEEDP